MQSKTWSLIESITNIAVGFGVALMAQIVVFPLFDISIAMNQNLQIALIFTMISLCRSYLLRRVFNALHQ